MNLETFFAFAAILIGFVMIFLTGFTWVQQDKNKWPWSFQALLTAATLWLVAYSLNFVSGLITDKIFLTKVQYLGIVTLPVFWFLFSLYFVNQTHRVTRNFVVALFAIPTISIILIISNELHGWFWSSLGLATDNQITYVSTEYGIWFWFHTAYSYFMLLIGTVFMLRGVIRFSGRARRQALILASAVVFPWAANIIFLAGLNPFPAIDWTPFALALSCIGFIIAIFGYETAPWQSLEESNEAVGN